MNKVYINGVKVGKKREAKGDINRLVVSHL